MRVRTLLPLLLLFFLATSTAPAQARTLGERTLGKGDHGWDVVVLQRVLGMRGYHPGPVDGAFGPRTKRAVKSFQRKRRLTVDGRVGPQTTTALSTGWPLRTASYYGPGLWGNRTACGQVLRHGTRGVAHRTLPCGTRLAVYANGRIALATVIDRGPHRDGVTFDLTRATARALGLTTTASVRAGW
jgi:peptidoglycan hydrolase-like protein with peptidoglycan-binding domain